MSEYTPNLNLFKYNTSTDGKEVFSISQALNRNWDILDQNSGSRNIGEIVASTIPLTDAGLHLLDGALVDGSGAYSAFYEYMVSLWNDGYTQLFWGESDWQSCVTNHGVCGKFVLNQANRTIRLPKITGIIEGTTDLTALLELVEAGLPEHKHRLAGDQTEGGSYINYYPDNAIKYTGVTGNTDYKMTLTAYTQGDEPTLGYTGSASIYDSIYGNSTTVQPQTIKVLYYIVIATSTKTSIQVDIDEIATDLNGKADVDLSNITASQSAKNEIISWGNPDWANCISMPLPTQPVSSTTETYTCPSDGYILIDADKASSGNTLFVFINSITVASTAAWQPSNANLFYRVCKGDVIKITTDNTSGNWSVVTKLFIPMKGAE